MSNLFNQGLGPQTGISNSFCQADPLGNQCGDTPLGPSLSQFYQPPVVASITPFTKSQIANMSRANARAGNAEMNMRANAMAQATANYNSNPSVAGVL